MSAIEDAPRRDWNDLLKAVIEEAWRRARRRRRIYVGVVVAAAVIATVIVATLEGPSTTGGTPLAAGGSSAPAARVPPLTPGVSVRDFRLRGKQGRLTISIVWWRDRGTGFWNVHGRPPDQDLRSGQYDALGGAKGKHVEAGGHASGWYARLVGLAIPYHAPKQRVVIKLKGRPEGTFVLIPMEPGVLKRDSGTQSSRWFG
jgi:hypothetical protein